MTRMLTLLGAHLADRPHLALLERAQELRLQIERQLADLVEEQRAAVGLLDEAALGVERAGEGAAHVAEQLRADRARAAARRSRRRRTDPARATSAGGSPRRAAPCRCRSRPRAARSPRCSTRGRAGRTAPSCSASRRSPDRSARPRSRCIATGTSAGDDLDLGVVAELEPGGAVERDRADPRRPLEGAVGRVEVGDLEPVGAQLQLEVIARHALVGQPQIVVLVRPDAGRCRCRSPTTSRCRGRPPPRCGSGAP